MLNLVMTHSPKLAAMANNKRLGEDVNTSHAIRHRLAWRWESRKNAIPVATEPAEQADTEPALRERTA